MARGWESKSVEAQQAEASEKASQPRAKLTPGQARLKRQREGLQLKRQRVLQQLSNASDPRHRQMLEHALSDLDRQIQALPTS